jgi:hypothetical protein
MAADGARSGWLARLLGNAKAFEASLETSVRPWAILIGGLGGIYLIGVLVLTLRGSPFDDRPFDAAVWRTSPMDGESARGQMLDDVMQKHLPIGMPRREVHTLLGEPDARGPHASFWRIGDWSANGFDRLAVSFDATDKLSRTEHVRP